MRLQALLCPVIILGSFSALAAADDIQKVVSAVAGCAHQDACKSAESIFSRCASHSTSWMDEIQPPTGADTVPTQTDSARATYTYPKMLGCICVHSWYDRVADCEQCLATQTALPTKSDVDIQDGVASASAYMCGTNVESGSLVLEVTSMTMVFPRAYGTVTTADDQDTVYTTSMVADIWPFDDSTALPAPTAVQTITPEPTQPFSSGLGKAAPTGGSEAVISTATDDMPTGTGAAKSGANRMQIWDRGTGCLAFMVLVLTIT